MQQDPIPDLRIYLPQMPTLEYRQAKCLRLSLPALLNMLTGLRVPHRVQVEGMPQDWTLVSYQPSRENPSEIEVLLESPEFEAVPFDRIPVFVINASITPEPGEVASPPTRAERRRQERKPKPPAGPYENGKKPH